MKLLLILVIVYVAIALLLYLLQDRLVFPGAGRGDLGLPVLPRMVTGVQERAGNEEFRIATLSSETVHGVLLWFGGNGEDLYSGAVHAELMSRYGLLVIAAEYPGFGTSVGAPGVASIMECAEVTAEFGKRRAAELKVPLFVAGSSLGTFPALYLASKGIGERLLLCSPPTSIQATARRSYWWLPLGLLLRHQFDNLTPAAKVKCPVLIVHGAADTIVPPDMGRELAAAMPQAEFVLVPGCGHNDLDLSPSGPVAAKVAAFLGAAKGR
jgi:uncharacterized protein